MKSRKAKSLTDFPSRAQWTHQEYYLIVGNLKNIGLANLIDNSNWTKHIEGFVLFNRYYSPDIDIDNFKITSDKIFFDLNSSGFWP